MLRRSNKPGMRSIPAIIALTIVAMFATSGCRSKSKDENEPIKLYYVILGIETFVPVMPDEMEKKGRYCAMASAQDVKTIRLILDKSVGSSAKAFSDGSARVKLIARDGSLIAFIDNYGGIRFADGRDGRIPGRDLKALKNVIESLCGF